MLAADLAPYVAAAAVVAAPTFAAVVAGVFSIKKQNTQQHAAGKGVSEAVLTSVNELRTSVATLDTKIDSHIQWHAHTAPNVVRIIREEASSAELA